MAFENLLLLAEETDRTAISDLAKKYPWIKDRADLADKVQEYAPRLSALHEAADVLTGFDSNVKEVEAWREWKKDKWPVWDAANVKAKQDLTEAQNKLALYEAGEINMTPEEIDALIDKRIAAKGLVAATDVDTRLTAGLEKFGNERVIPSMNEWGGRIRSIYAKLTPKIGEHAKMFDGEVLDPEPILKYMDDNKIVDPTKAYDAVMAPRMQERAQKMQAAEIDKARKEGLAEGQRAAAASSGRAMPVGGGSTPAAAGPLVSRYRTKFAEKLAAGQTSAEAAPLGKGIIAHAAGVRHFEKELAAGQS